MSKCKCSMAISLTGDGCRHCQPQEYIDRLEAGQDSLISDYNEAAADAMELAVKLRAAEAERGTLRAENHRLREALKTAALAMWRSESNMDSEAADAEEALSSRKEPGNE